jgi:hypothetical protein
MPDCRCNEIARLVLDFDGLDGAGLGCFAAGILEFLGDIFIETADRQFILHLEDIRADVRAALTADAEIVDDFGFHFPSFFQLRVADRGQPLEKIEKMGCDAGYG